MQERKLQEDKNESCELIKIYKGHWIPQPNPKQKELHCQILFNLGETSRDTDNQRMGAKLVSVSGLGATEHYSHDQSSKVQALDIPTVLQEDDLGRRFKV